MHLRSGEGTAAMRCFRGIALGVLLLFVIGILSATVLSARAGDRIYDTSSTTNQVMSYSGKYQVKVIMGARSTTLYLGGGTVANAIALAGFTYDADDLVSPSIDTAVTDKMEIVVTPVFSTVTVENTVLPFASVEEQSNDLYEGETKLKTAGVDGEIAITYSCVYEDGIITQKEELSREVVTPAVDQVTLIGTRSKTQTPSTAVAASAARISAVSGFRQVVAGVAASTGTLSEITSSASVNDRLISKLCPDSTIALDDSGRPVNYSQLISGLATAYTYHDGENFTACGAYAGVGLVAVNPNQIPYGSKLFIRTASGDYMYGYAVAADTGGFVNAGRVTVDLFFETEAQCQTFGVRNVEIYVIG